MILEAIFIMCVWTCSALSLSDSVGKSGKINTQAVTEIYHICYRAISCFIGTGTFLYL